MPIINQISLFLLMFFPLNIKIGCKIEKNNEI